MGATVTCNEGKPPVEILDGLIKDNFSYEMPIASAQVKPSIILAALAANKKVTVIEKHPTRNHTERMISYFNGDIQTESHDLGNKITLMPTKLIPTKKSY